MSRARFALCLIALTSACAAASPVTPSSDVAPRLVTSPSALVVVTERDEPPGTPGAITFGGSRGRAAIYLAFDHVWQSHGKPIAAFVALEPRLGATPDPNSVRIEAWRVNGPWPANFDWAAKPPLAPPYASIKTNASPARPLRIDVSEIVRYLDKHPGSDHGLALIASGGDGHGATFSTGISGGNAPRLEVYAR